MKTVLYLISTLHRTGPTNVLAGVVKNLDKNRFHPVVVTLSSEPDETNSWQTELKNYGVEIHSLNLTRWQGVVSAKKQLKQLMKDIRPNLIHAHCFRSVLLAACFKGYKKIATIHCDYEIDFKMTYGNVWGTSMSLLFARALRHMDVRVSCSKMLADLLNRKYPNLHFDYVDNGVDTDKFHSITDKTVLRKQLGLPIDKKIIVWAGSFIVRKDPLTMARAILQIPKNQYYFIFCGEGPLWKECKELLQNRKDVLFTGHINNIEKYYQAADIYVSTSLSEGFHLTVYEAMSCGLPVILTDIDVYVNLKNNPAIYFFTSKDVSALTARINELTQQNLQTLGKTVCQTVEQHYSAKQMAQNYMQKYERIYYE